MKKKPIVELEKVPIYSGFEISEKVEKSTYSAHCVSRINSICFNVGKKGFNGIQELELFLYYLN